MSYKIFFLNTFVTERETRDLALDFICACKERREDFEIRDQSDVCAS